MKKSLKYAGIALMAGAIMTVASIATAQGGADYGRGPETDPVASALSGVVSGRVTVLESRSNTWNTAATSAATLTGQVATIQGRTNDWNTGATSAADWTNHAAGMVAAVTNVIPGADGKTNTIVVERGSIKTWTVSP
jgi:hypothetical protein